MVTADLRFALRALRHSRGFAFAAVATLALGIGANTAIFSVVNTVFLRPLPYPHPERIVWATEFFPKSARPVVLMPEYAAWQQSNTAFDRLEATRTTIGVNLLVAGRSAERVQAGHVTPGFFAMLGVSPALGRDFTGNQASAALISDSLWRGYFQSDPHIVGTAINLNGAPATIIGVMPPGLLYPDAADTRYPDGADAAVWLPDAVDAQGIVPRRSMRIVNVIGRLKPAVSVAQAQSDLEVVARRMDSQYPSPWSTSHAQAHVRVVSLHDQLVSDSRTALLVLMGAVAFVLLIVCANVANLFLARAAARNREIAIRAAIGASRARIVRLLLLESSLLGILGGALGIAFLFWTTSALRFLLPKALAGAIPVDWRVLLFATACSLAAGLLFGLAPAITASRLDLTAGLKETGGLSGPRRGARLRGSLAVAQLALSVVLLIGAGLLIRSFLVLLTVNPGFDPRNVLLADVSLAPLQVYGPPQQAEFAARAVQALERLPGVQSAAATSSPPMTTFNAIASGLHAEGEPESDEAVAITSASSHYFRALGIPILAGRSFDERDAAGAPRVVIVNQALARILFRGRDPIGRRIVNDPRDPGVTVIGVAADTRHRALDDKVWPELYQSFSQSPSPWISVVVKTASDPSGSASAVRRAVQSMDPKQPLFDVESLDQRLSASVSQRRQRALLVGSFGLLALFIAAIGVYGVMAYSVARRTHEIGIRVALGAQRPQVLRLVVIEGLRLAFLGTALGLAGALSLTRVLKSFLYGVTATDPLTFVSVVAALVAAASLASYIPARRATRVDPLVALRHE